jgi:hypothetical protein
MNSRSSWVDVQIFIQVEYAQGQSYRQIKAKLDDCLHSSISLRTIDQKVLPLGHQASLHRTWKPGFAPPVVRLDGIWLTVMFALGGFEGRIETGTIILVEKTIVYDIIEQMGDADEAIEHYSTEVDLSWLDGRQPSSAVRGLMVSGDRTSRC